MDARRLGSVCFLRALFQATQPDSYTMRKHMIGVCPLRLRAIDPLNSGLLHAMCIKAIAVLFALLMVALAPVSGWTQGVAKSSVYLVAPGDRLIITVFGQTELSGDFIVDDAGSIPLPLVGAIAVEGMTVAEVGQHVTKRLAEGYIQQPVVSVRVIEFRPIFIVGDVRSPGVYAYRHGTMVISAIAMAGGFGASEQTQGSLRSDFLLAEERVRLLEATRRGLLVRKVRLEAQRDGAAEFGAGNEIDLQDESVKPVIALEQETLASQSRALAQELALLNDQQPRIDAEIRGVREQSRAESAQLKLIQSHMEDYNKLLTNGLARRYTGIELQREEERNKGNIARLAADVSRLEYTLGEISLKIQTVQSTYQQKVLADLQDVRTRLRELDVTIPMARELRETRLQVGSAMMATSPESVRRTITIVRRGRDESQTLAATETTVVAPGDIIEVRRELPQTLGQGSASAKRAQGAASTVRPLPVAANAAAANR